jgi:uncharacterized flavoprotein (TIGR03862 family)
LSLPLTASPSTQPSVAIVGGGPAGLMAAEVLTQHGVSVDLYDAMPSVGRKFLLAGRGGLNLTHAEPLEDFLTRFGDRQADLAPQILAFTPDMLRQWVHELGIDTFVGSSGRVFPTDMKAAPLLRAWLHRLRAQGVRFHMRHRWLGWAEGEPQTLVFQHPGGELRVRPQATLLALGGASWPRLGSDGAWVPWLQAQGLEVAPLVPANCGFDVQAGGAQGDGWSEFLRSRHAGQPIKPVTLALTDVHGQAQQRQGEFVLTDQGVEGSLIYAFSAPIRELIARDGQATVHLDLLPAHTAEQVRQEVARPRGPRSLGTHLKSRLGIQGIKSALLHELLTPAELADADVLAHRLKALPLVLRRPRPLAEAISTAGGVTFASAASAHTRPNHIGLFVAGEMLDWEAPTGGYLLTACMANARSVSREMLAWLQNQTTTC